MAGDVRFGRLEVLRPLGSGTFATVYLAHDPRLDALVAVKVLADNWARRPDVRQRFEDEGRLLRRVDDPRVIRVHDMAETADGRPYLVVQYADGATLAQRLAQGTAAGLAPDWPVPVVQDIAGGLAALHAAGVVHRDLAPTNVLLHGADAHGRPRALLADLGVAKDLRWASGLTQPTGTGQYRAPEQHEYSAAIGPATDVYAFAVLIAEVLRSVGRQDLLGPGPLADELAVARRRDPAHRCVGVGELAAAVERAFRASAAPPTVPAAPAAPAASAPAAAPVPGPPPAPAAVQAAPPTRPRAKRRRRLLGGVLVAVVAAIAAGGVVAVRRAGADRTTVVTRDGSLRLELAGRWAATGSATVPGAARSSGVVAVRRDGGASALDPVRIDAAITDEELALPAVAAAVRHDECAAVAPEAVADFEGVALRWSGCPQERSYTEVAVRSRRSGTIYVRITGAGAPTVGEVLAALRVPKSG